MKEFAFIDQIRRTLDRQTDVPIGPGDDAALACFAAPQGLLYTVDMLMDGVHFRLPECGAFRAGRKAMAVNLSDIAAMGGEALGALIAVAIPRGQGKELAESLFNGLKAAADEFGVAILGGDTNSWNGALCVSVTMVGRPHPKGPLLRRGARPGDVVCVTGPLGGSLDGHHLDFTPRLREIKKLMDGLDLHAGIDLSDGLSSDAAHIARESGVRLVLEAHSLPLRANIAQQHDGRARALHDGEDFELCVCLTPEQWQVWQGLSVTDAPLHKIGYVTSGQGVYLEEPDGRLQELVKEAYEHQL